MKTLKVEIFLLSFISTLINSHVEASPTISAHAMAVSISREADEAGLRVMRQGGNAADGAVATALALAVTRPYYGSIGGGGFMLMKFNGNPVEALDHRERAPLKSTADMYLKTKNADASETGGLAVATPGSVAGLVALHEKYGKLRWSLVVQPAIDLAEKGFSVSQEWVSITQNEEARFTPAALKHLSLNKKTFPQVGERLKQPKLAEALRLIQKNKGQGFYEGAVAQDLVQSVRDSGGILSLDDLKKYKVRWLKPLELDFKGHHLFTMPAPSSGGIFLNELLGLAERLGLSSKKPLGADEFHLMGESMARVASGRSLLGDPDFSALPTKNLLSAAHLDRLAQSISLKKKTSFVPDPQLPKVLGDGGSHEGGNTTHYCVVDSQGQVVSATLTLNGYYGSAVVSEKFGVALNNEMDDFNTKPGKPNMFGLVQGDANKVEPMKTPLSSMTPTLIFDGKRNFEMAVGSPGGPRIISAVFQVVYHALTTDWNLQQIITAPRVHHQYLPDTLFYDEFGVSPDTLDLLMSKGHTLLPAVIARVYAIRKTKKGLLEGASDPRGEGFAEGY